MGSGSRPHRARRAFEILVVKSRGFWLCFAGSFLQCPRVKRQGIAGEMVATFPPDGQGAVSSLEAQCFDVGSGRF